MEAYLRVTAPFSGIITERNVHPGALVGPSGGAAQAPMFRLEQNSRLRLVVAVPEVDVSGIARGGQVTFTRGGVARRNVHRRGGARRRSPWTRRRAPWRSNWT